MDTVKELVSGIAGLFTALSALIAATASLIKARRDWVKESQPPSPTKPSKGKRHESRILALLRMPAFVVGLLLLFFSLAIFAVRTLLPTAPLHERLTALAWRHYDAQEYKEAIEKAEACISEFGGEAVHQQQAISEPVPTGSVDPSQKMVIFSHGVLNDVATCYLITGMSFEKLKQTDKAAQAYQEAQKLNRARTWDDNGEWFWSPADKASDRIDSLGGKK
jgi:tetratricopeptide (TPR) repeat protein